MSFSLIFLEIFSLLRNASFKFWILKVGMANSFFCFIFFFFYFWMSILSCFLFWNWFTLWASLMNIYSIYFIFYFFFSSNFFFKLIVVDSCNGFPFMRSSFFSKSFFSGRNSWFGLGIHFFYYFRIIWNRYYFWSELILTIL